MDIIPTIPQWAIDEDARKLRRGRRRCEAFVGLLGADYPVPRAKAEWGAYSLLRRRWTRPQIRAFVAAYATDSMTYPGILDTPGEMGLYEFLACVGILAEGEYARTLPREEMLGLLAGADAVRGAAAALRRRLPAG